MRGSGRACSKNYADTDKVGGPQPSRASFHARRRGCRVQELLRIDALVGWFHYQGPYRRNLVPMGCPPLRRYVLFNMRKL